MAQITCSFPGCDEPGRRHGRVCQSHFREREIPGYRDRYCQLCGFGPRVSLATHVNKFHDGSAAYKRQFGDEALTSADLRFNSRARYSDWLKDESGLASHQHRKQRTCRKGHRLAGANVILDANGGRRCRKCAYESARRRYAKQGYPGRTWTRRRRQCEWCKERFMPTAHNQRFCCVQHRNKAKWLRAQRE